MTQARTRAQLLASVRQLSNELTLLRAAIRQSGDADLRQTLSTIEVLAALDVSLVGGSVWPTSEEFPVAPGQTVKLSRTVPGDQHLVLTSIEQPGLDIRLSRFGAALPTWGRDVLTTWLWLSPGALLNLDFTNYGDEVATVATARFFGFSAMR